MKTVFASILALSMLAAPAYAAGLGVHVGPIGVGMHVGGHHHHGCRSWGWHHHCRRWW
jgi:hypothetical protein